MPLFADAGLFHRIYNRNSVVILYADDGFILSLVKSLRSLHMAAGAVVMYEGEIADEM